MKAYVVIEGNDLLGIFRERERASKISTHLPEVYEVELFTSTAICRDSDDSFSLFCVEIEGESYWIRAKDFAAALVDAALYRRTLGLSDGEAHRVLCYSLPLCDYGRRVCVSADEREVGPLMKRALAALTWENRDLVTHVLEGLELLDTEEELWQREVYRNTPPRVYPRRCRARALFRYPKALRRGGARDRRAAVGECRPR